MQGLVERAVDVVRAIDVDRRKKARQRGGGLNRTGDGNVIEARAAEGGRRSGIEVGRDDE